MLNNKRVNNFFLNFTVKPNLLQPTTCSPLLNFDPRFNAGIPLTESVLKGKKKKAQDKGMA